MKDRSTLTKSLHTITVCAQVARLLLDTQEFKHLKKDTPRALAAAALDVLGYTITEYNKTDDVVVRCIAACAKVQAETNGKK